MLPATDKVACMRLRKLVVTYIVAFHPLTLQLRQHTTDLLLSFRRVKYKGQEDMCYRRRIITISKLCNRSWMNGGMQSYETERLLVISIIYTIYVI